MVRYLMNFMTHRSLDNVIFSNFRNETLFSIEFMSGETYKTLQMCEDNFQRDSQGTGSGPKVLFFFVSKWSFFFSKTFLRFIWLKKKSMALKKWDHFFFITHGKMKQLPWPAILNWIKTLFMPSSLRKNWDLQGRLLPRIMSDELWST